ncbi:hypothetical protein [Mesorhizobium sp. WSM3866]|uniref:hypothetical protein n=1 Tax=Mesorhizobium sp. WSM3866 TaxID=422271 RepID=UPI0011409A20|nr:hypothetical protein [Mesorhizobium sp. WSM3866]
MRVEQLITSNSRVLHLTDLAGLQGLAQYEPMALTPIPILKHQIDAPSASLGVTHQWIYYSRTGILWIGRAVVENDCAALCYLQAALSLSLSFVALASGWKRLRKRRQLWSHKNGTSFASLILRFETGDGPIICPLAEQGGKQWTENRVPNQGESF